MYIKIYEGEFFNEIFECLVRLKNRKLNIKRVLIEKSKKIVLEKNY